MPEPYSTLDPKTNLPIEYSKTPSLPSVNIKNMADARLRFNTPIGGAIPSYSKYDEYLTLEDIPNLELERGLKQPKIASLGNAVSQALVGEIAGGTVEGVGWLVDFFSADKFARESTEPMGNAITQFGKSIRENTQSDFPVYKTYEDGKFSPGNWSWWMNGLPSVASTFSMYIPATGFVKGLGALGKLTKAGKLMSNLSKAARVTLEGITTAVVSREIESMMEASGGWEEQYNLYISKGVPEKEARIAASKTAADIYRKDWVMLIQDIPQAILFHSSFGSRSLDESIGAARRMGKKTLPLLGKKTGEKTWDMFTEGGEEAYQYIVGQNAKYLVDKSYAKDKGIKFDKTLDDYIKKGELWTNALFGAIGAGVLQTVGKKAKDLVFGKHDPTEEDILSWSSQFAYYYDEMNRANEIGTPIAKETARAGLLSSLITKSAQTGNIQNLKDFLNIMSNPSEADIERFNMTPESIEAFKDILPEVNNKINRVSDLYEANLKKHKKSENPQRAAAYVTQMEFLGEEFAQQKYKVDEAITENLNKIYNYNKLSYSGRNIFDAELKLNAEQNKLRFLNNRLKEDESLDEDDKSLLELSIQRTENNIGLLNESIAGEKELYTDIEKKNDSKYNRTGKKAKIEVLSTFDDNHFKGVPFDDVIKDHKTISFLDEEITQLQEGINKYDKFEKLVKEEEVKEEETVETENIVDEEKESKPIKGDKALYHSEEDGNNYDVTLLTDPDEDGVVTIQRYNELGEKIGEPINTPINNLTIQEREPKDNFDNSTDPDSKDESTEPLSDFVSEQVRGLKYTDTAVSYSNRIDDKEISILKDEYVNIQQKDQETTADFIARKNDIANRIKRQVQVRNEAFDQLISNPNTDLKDNKVSFEIDLNNEYFDEHKDIKKKIESGNLTKKEIDRLLSVENENKFKTEPVDNIPIQLGVTIGSETHSKGLYVHSSKYDNISIPNEIKNDSEAIKQHKIKIQKRTRESRRLILSNLLAGNEVKSTIISKTKGFEYTGKTNNNLAEIFGEQSKDIELAIADSTGKLWVNDNKYLDSTGNPGNVFASTNKTANGEEAPVKLNVSKLSKEHSNILFDTILQRYASEKSGKNATIENEDIYKITKTGKKSKMTTGELMELLVYYGKAQDEKFSSKQLYIGKSSTGQKRMLYYGENGLIDLYNKEEVAAKRDDFIEWATTNKNYSTIKKHSTYGIELNKPTNFGFKIGSFEHTYGNKYSQFLIDNNIVKTDIQPFIVEDGKTISLFNSPVLLMDSTESGLNVTTKADKVKAKQKKELKGTKEVKPTIETNVLKTADDFIKLGVGDEIIITRLYIDPDTGKNVDNSGIYGKIQSIGGKNIYISESKATNAINGLEWNKDTINKLINIAKNTISSGNLRYNKSNIKIEEQTDNGFINTGDTDINNVSFGQEEILYKILDGTEQKPYPQVNIKAELKWFRDKVSKTFPIKIVNRIISIAQEGKHIFGEFRKDLITISNTAIEGTLYHEAFHLVSKLYLGEIEREFIYNEARKRYAKKLNKQFGESNYHKNDNVEEVLAEEFRKYKLAKDNNKPTTLIGKIGKFFSELYQIISDFFTGKNRILSSEIDRLFEDIRSGKFLSTQISKNNFNSLKDKSYLLEYKEAEIPSLNTYTQLYKIIKGLTNSLLTTAAKGIEFTDISQIKQILGNISFNNLRSTIENNVNVYRSVAVNNPKQTVDAERLANIYQDVLDNFQIFKEGIEDYMEYELKIRPVVSEDVEEDFAQKEITNFDKQDYEISRKDNMLTGIKFLISNLYESKNKDEFTGMGVFADFSSTWNKLSRDLWKVKTVEQMMDILRDKSKDFVYLQLLKKLELGSETLRTQFENTFNTWKHNFINAMFNIDENGKPKYVFLDADVQDASKLLFDEWSRGFSQSSMFIEEKGEAIKLNKEKILEVSDQYEALNKKMSLEYKSEKTINDDYYTKEIVKLLNNFNILADESTIRDFVEKNIDPVSYENGLRKFISINVNPLFNKSTSSIVDYAKNGTIDGDKVEPKNILKSEKIIGKIATSYINTHEGEVNPMVPGIGDATHYQYGENNVTTDLIKSIKNDPSYLDKYMKDIYANDSFFLEQMLEEGTIDKLGILTLNGAIQFDVGDKGKEYQDFTYLENYMIKLSFMMSDNLPFPTLANRKTYFLLKGLKRLKFDFTIDENGNETISDDVIDRFVTYAITERNRINTIKEYKKTGTSNLINYYSQAVSGKGNNALKHVLFPELNKISDKDFDSKVREVVEKSLNGLIENELIEASKLDIIDVNRKNGKLVVTSNNLIEDSLLKKHSNYNSKTMSAKAVIADYAINTAVTIIELEKLLYGDPAFAKDIRNKIKRLGITTSTGGKLREKVPGKYESKTYKTATLNTERISSIYYDSIHKLNIELMKKENEENDLGLSDNQILSIVNEKLSSYNKIDPTDAQVYISPEMYRETAERIGEWSDQKQKAFDLLQSTDELTPQQEIESLGIFLQPLKLVYFGLLTNSLSENKTINVPTYDKMSLATLFRRFTTGTQLDELLDRMEGVGKYEGKDKIQMIKYDSAVKIGGIKGSDLFKEDGTVSDLSDMTTQDQSWSDLRRQLVTDPHDVQRTPFATQVKKVGILNIKLDKDYELNGKPIKGKELVVNIFKSLKSLSDKGKQKVIDKFGIVNDNINNEKFAKLLRKEAKMANMPDDFINNIKVEGSNLYLNIDTFSDRKWIYNRLISMVAKETIDTKLPGNQLIQVSGYGLRKASEYKEGMSKAEWLKTTEELKFIRVEDGKILPMEALLPIQIFKQLIPDYSNKTFKEKVDWLKKNTKDIVEGIGYRIPTQGQNSVFAIKPAGFLPEQMGDSIVLPNEFTALTGSDFDIDKLFFVTKNYFTDKQGNVFTPEFLNVDTNTDEGLELLYHQNYDRLNNFKKLLEEVKQKVDHETGFIAKLGKELLFEYEDIAAEILLKYSEVLEDWGINKIKASEVEIILEDLNNTIPTLEKYIEDNRGKDKHTLNSKFAVENNLIDLYTSVLTSNNNFLQTSSALGHLGDILKQKSTRLADTQEDNTNMMFYSPSFQSKVKSEFVDGERGIGPFALNNVHHALAQIAKLYIGIDLDFGNKTENGDIDLSQQYGMDKRLISDWLSALIDANVDNPTDPYITTLNVVPKTYNLVNLLIRMGVGIQTFDFIAQPILKDLVKNAKNKDSKIGKPSGNELYKTKQEWEDKLRFALGKEDKAKKDIINQYEGNIFEGKYLNDDLKPKEETVDFIARQLDILEMFVKLDKIAYELSRVVQYSQIDTKKFGTSLSDVNVFIDEMSNMLKSNVVKNIKSLIPYNVETGQVEYTGDEGLFLGGYLDNGILYINKLFGNKSITSTKTTNVLQNEIYNSINTNRTSYDLSNNVSRLEKKNKLLTTINNELYTYFISGFFTNEDQLNMTTEKFNKLAFGKNSVVDKIMDIQNGKIYEDLKENKLIASLKPIYKDGEFEKFLSFPSTKTDKWLKNELQYSWKQLLNDDRKEIQALAKQLFIYSYLTSGFNKGFYTFFEFVPESLKKEMRITDDQGERIVSFDNYIKSTLSELNDTQFGITKFSDAVREVIINNADNENFVPIFKGYVNYNLVSKDTNIPLIIERQLEDKDLGNVSRFIKRQNKVYELIGSTHQHNAVYKLINVKSKHNKAKSMVEYGLDKSIIATNNSISQSDMRLQEEFITNKMPDLLNLDEPEIVYDMEQPIVNIVEESPFLSDEEIINKGVDVQYSTDLTEEELKDLKDKYKHCK